MKKAKASAAVRVVLARNDMKLEEVLVRGRLF